jgi:hypothetical protein
LKACLSPHFGVQNRLLPHPRRRFQRRNPWVNLAGGSEKTGGNKKAAPGRGRPLRQCGGFPSPYLSSIGSSQQVASISQAAPQVFDLQALVTVSSTSQSSVLHTSTSPSSIFMAVPPVGDILQASV